MMKRLNFNKNKTFDKKLSQFELDQDKTLENLSSSMALNKTKSTKVPKIKSLIDDTLDKFNEKECAKLSYAHNQMKW